MLSVCVFYKLVKINLLIKRRFIVHFKLPRLMAKDLNCSVRLNEAYLRQRTLMEECDAGSYHKYDSIIISLFLISLFMKLL